MPATPDGQQIGVHGDITFTIRGADCLDLLEPLWLELYDHHLQVGAADIRTIARHDSWPRRRGFYERLIADTPDAFVVLAERQDGPVGYAFCRLEEGHDDTWDTGEWVGEVETLVISPRVRGDGLGTALLDAAEAELARRGARDVLIAVMEGNDRAMEFYRRRGMTPTVTYLMRLGPREGSEPG